MSGQAGSTASSTNPPSPALRGNPTEGHFLTFEAAGFALAYTATSLKLSPATATHAEPSQRFILHAASPEPTNSRFTVQTATLAKPMYIDMHLGLTSDASKAMVFTISDRGNGQGYAVQLPGPKAQTLQFQNGRPVVAAGNAPQLHLFSVTY